MDATLNAKITVLQVSNSEVFHHLMYPGLVYRYVLLLLCYSILIGFVEHAYRWKANM